MNLNVHSIHFDADAKLEHFIREKLDKLNQFHDRIIDGQVFLRLEHDGENRENKVVEVRMNIPGKELFAKRQSRSFEEAADHAAEALRRQLLRAKPRLRKAS
ncbi:MAG: ribosome-associated translation inhibitor RaiA [Flavobacteriales bacterium]|nr:ribosome-associated translation inhibitor RaiA [Flavobacteriales bacterium]MCB9167707.1 ribosome-associated translation inhibitor RaiA [Flavobacteriales bacterium]